MKQKIVMKWFRIGAIIIIVVAGAYYIIETRYQRLEAQAIQKGLLQKWVQLPAPAQLDELVAQAMQTRQNTAKLFSRVQDLSGKETDSFIALFDQASANVSELAKNPFDMGAMGGCIQMMLVMLQESDKKKMNFSTEQKKHILQVLREISRQCIGNGKKNIINYTNLCYSLMSQRPLLHPHIDFWRYSKDTRQPQTLKNNERYLFLATVIPIFDEYDRVVKGGTPSNPERTDSYSGFFIRLIAGIPPSAQALTKEISQRITTLQKSLPAE